MAMQKLSHPVETPSTTSGFKPGRFYPDGTLAGKIEAYLLEKGIPVIGDANWRLTLEIKSGSFEGSVRPASLEMSSSARAYRTRDVLNLSYEQMLQLQDYEHRRMTRFVMGPSEIRGICKTSSGALPNQTFMTPEEIERYNALNDKVRPEMTTLSSVAGFESAPRLPIPPYFIYDNNFDGMFWHHAIDRNVWKIGQP